MTVEQIAATYLQRHGSATWSLFFHIYRVARLYRTPVIRYWKRSRYEWMLHHYFFSTVGWLHPIIARHRCAREDELELVKCTKKSKETCQASTCENVSEKLSVNGGFWVRIFLRKVILCIRTRTPSYLHTFCKFFVRNKTMSNTLQK